MNLDQAVVEAVTVKAGVTHEVLEAQGFVASNRMIRNFMNELDAVIVHSPAAMKVIDGSNSAAAAAGLMKKQTITALTKRAFTNLKEKLELKAIELAIRVFNEDGDMTMAGTGAYTIDGAKEVTEGNELVGAYTLALLTELSYRTLSQCGIKDSALVSTFANGLIYDATLFPVLNEFQEDFCPGLTQGVYKLGLGRKYFDFTAAEGETHGDALVAVLNANGVTDLFIEKAQAYASSVQDKIAQANERIKDYQEKTVAVKSLLSVLSAAATTLPEVEAIEEAIEETIEETIEEVATVEAETTEEMVTITLAEYNRLLAIEAVQDKNLEQLAEQRQVNEKCVALLNGLNEELEIKDEIVNELAKEKAALITENDKLTEDVLDLMEKNEELAKKLAATKKKEVATMEQFKLEIKSFSEVTVRPANEEKVIDAKYIENKQVGALLRGTVEAVDSGKKLNDKVRKQAPEKIVKAANATHNGIDTVATVAHKATNAVAKATNTSVLKSANVVDAVLDFVAPSKKNVNMDAINRTVKEAKEGQVVVVDGHMYQVVLGKFKAI